MFKYFTLSLKECFQQVTRVFSKTRVNGNVINKKSKVNFMKNFFWAVFAAMVIISSCQIDEAYNNETISDNDKFYATICNESSSKTVMDDNKNIRWSYGDQLVIFKKTSLGVKYQIQEAYVGETFGYFSKVTSSAGSDDFGAGMSIDHNIAYYPYSTDVKFAKSGNDYTLKVTLPSEQIYAPKSFGNGSFPMASVSADADLTFKNVCGGIKLQLKGTGKVGSIVIKGTNDEKLSGEAVVTVYADEAVPSIAMSDDASTSVTLNCGDGVQLNETTATEFIISLPPTTFTKGFAVTITDSDGNTQTIETSKENEVKRSSLLTMPEVTINSTSEGSSTINLSADGTANCYIVTGPGTYLFTPTKGNSSVSIGEIASVEVLWESFGTDVIPTVGDIIHSPSYSNGQISFKTAETFRNGNAVIAARNSENEILWSWHIWCTSEGYKEHIYANNAGTMMDRNLGATSATPGDVGALGLLYQWGRKDPFLGASKIDSSHSTRSISPIEDFWWGYISSGPHSGTIEYATAHPNYFISGRYSNGDWLYVPGYTSNSTLLWSSDKTEYDPCPHGWRVPDGYGNGVWSVAGFDDTSFDSMNKGILFPSTICGEEAWYPATGALLGENGSLGNTGYYGYYWSTAMDSDGYPNYYLSFDRDGNVNSSKDTDTQYIGMSVRCQKENTGGGQQVPDQPSINLAIEGTANCYIVTEAGTYSFPTVKGCSSTSVGTVFKAKVIWESYGTDEKPEVGDIIASTYYKDNTVVFTTPETFREGNALIAAIDASNDILWSWHIWCTAEGYEEQVYANNAGTMMDRNLGAVSATPGDVGALGLLYQWGRKDPFLSSSAINEMIHPMSTITWPEEIESTSSTGTFEYATKHPTTSISGKNVTEEQTPGYFYTTSDWMYNSPYNFLWKSVKTVYDPCPHGWRVCDGGPNGVWKVAGIPKYVLQTEPSKYYDEANRGLSFPASICGTISWYPNLTSYHSATAYEADSGLEKYSAYYMVLNSRYMHPAGLSTIRDAKYFVRCQKTE